MQAYENAVDFINHIGKYGAHPGIENSARLLDALGHPECGLKIVHVAGTNGKGSVCAFLADMLTAQGFRTGLFISPHLIDIRERIQLDREMISKEEFADCFFLVNEAEQELARNGYTGITYFDYLFAIALCWYQKQAPDYVVVETGLGGRMDSTNAISSPLLTIITSISFDHTEILGDTIEKIAAEKAGIIKPGVPLVYCADDKDACEVITHAAQKAAAPCVGIGRRNCKWISGEATAGAESKKAFSHREEMCQETQNKEAAAQAQPCGGSASCTVPAPYQLKFTFCLPAADCAVLNGERGQGNAADKEIFSNGIQELLTVNSPALYQAENAAIAYTAAVWLHLLAGRTAGKKIDSNYNHTLSFPAAGISGSFSENTDSRIFCVDEASGSSPENVSPARDLNFSALIPQALRATLQHALARSVWEGRFEQVLPNVYLDGAHNADGIRMLLASLRPVAAGRAVTLLFAAVREKDTDEMIREICESGLFCRYLVTTVGGARAIAPDVLKEKFSLYTELPVATYASPQKAFAAGLELAGINSIFPDENVQTKNIAFSDQKASDRTDYLLLCAGSLYLVGIIKELLSVPT